MTRDEQIDVLKGLLARVRAGAMARGIELPKDHAREPSEVTFSTRAPRESSASLPIASHEEPAPEPLVPAPSTRPAEARNGGLTAFAETGTGTHAPLALVGEPPPDREGLASQLAAAALAPPPGLVDDDDDDNEQLPVTAVSISFDNQAAELRAPQAPPLQPPPSRLPFEAAFEDEITSAGDPAEIEAAVLERAQSSRRIPTPPPTPPPSTRVPTGGPPKRAPSVPPAPPTRVVDPIPPAPPTRVVTPVPPAAPTRVTSPTASPQRMSSLPAVPLTLDDLDLDGLGTPDA
ncbi:MAG: hypothetical protein JNK04_22120, partial [Myxococcales bacterium]|nr:hypothetical protein [Myxococcales bacterium]